MPIVSKGLKDILAEMTFYYTCIKFNELFLMIWQKLCLIVNEIIMVENSSFCIFGFISVVLMAK
jgi:hypothetical protein